jgi:N-methylhydantoinase B
MTSETITELERRIDPVLMPVLANRLEAIVREMTNTLLRTGRSAVLNIARDFSCSIVTAENELLATAEGLPVHVFGSHLQTKAMTELHPDLAEGDAFLHNDPYLGNTHHADHTILVPVFVDGEHLFTACAKAHQADAGNSQPTSYMPFARDIYEEGALNFPCVRIQSGYSDNEDVIRMCRRRIRVPEQWYGDYLATLAAARIAERRLKELTEKYSVQTIRDFVLDWFDYSERRMTAALKGLPSGQLIGQGAVDPLPQLPDGIPIQVELNIDADVGRVEIDLRDNIDCVPAGLNESEACAINNVVTGVFNVLDADIPHNHGSFRRITVHLRENCVVGIPVHPTSCSVATTHVGDRLVNVTQAAFAEIGEGNGLAEGGSAMGPGFAVISGTDSRRNGDPFVNQLMIGINGGPAGPDCDGWLTWALPVCAGLLYRDSVEIDEQKYPIQIRSLELIPDSGGAGRHRGAPAGKLVFGPRDTEMSVIFPIDGHLNAPRGARGGLPGQPANALKIDASGAESQLPMVANETMLPGEWIVGIDCGGGGYGDPKSREPELVLRDVLEGWVSLEAARDLYGVVFSGSVEDETLVVDYEGTARQRNEQS